MNAICRICIQQTTGNVVAEASHKYKLMYCVPKIDLRVLCDATICNACYEALDGVYKFKIQCRDVEDKVNRYMKEYGIVNLNNLIQFYPGVFEESIVKQELNLNGDDVPKVCRTCLRRITDDFTSLNLLNKCKLMLCVPELDLWTVPDVTLCEDCCTTLDMAYKFLKQCLEVEKDINDYLQKHNLVDYNNFLTWYNLVIKDDTKTKLQDVVIKNELVDCDEKVNINLDNYLKQEFNTNDETFPEIKFCECIDNTADYQKYECNTDIYNNLEVDVSKHKYECSQCNYSTNKELCLKIHQQMHVGGQSFTCSHCDYSSLDILTLKRHFRIHTKDTPFKCLECDYNTTNKSSLKKHIQKHAIIKQFKCLHCEYSTHNKKYLKKHIASLKHHFKTTHPTKTLLKCPICSFSTRHKSTLKNHIRIHTGVKPYECPLCSYAAIQKSMLNRHMEKHTEGRAFKCTYCPFSTTYSSYLRCHIKIHTGETPYKCSLCDFTCGLRAILKNHVKVHSSNVQFKCSQCSYITKREMFLKKHCKIHDKKIQV